MYILFITRHFQAKDAEYFDDPDYAVASGTTGQPEVPKKKEWFI